MRIWWLQGVARNPQTGEETLVGRPKDMPMALALRRLSQGGWRKIREEETGSPEPIAEWKEAGLPAPLPKRDPKDTSSLGGRKP
jgi:hypothetical protein